MKKQKFGDKLFDLMNQKQLSVEETARLLGYSPRSIYYWIYDDKAPKRYVQQAILDTVKKS
jgi:succinate dehydrogenase flavin-adding protein (antitoxin of CptAB toxin-antitoxin module)